MWGSRCTWARSRLPLLAGGELTGPDRRELERHLILCPACRRRLEAQRRALGALHAAAEVPPARPGAPSLWPDLARQIRESRAPAARPLAIYTGPPAWAWAAFGGSLGALLLLAAALLGPVGSATLGPRTITIADAPRPPAPPSPAPAARPRKAAAPTMMTRVRRQAPPRSLDTATAEATAVVRGESDAEPDDPATSVASASEPTN